MVSRGRGEGQQAGSLGAGWSGARAWILARFECQSGFQGLLPVLIAGTELAHCKQHFIQLPLKAQEHAHTPDPFPCSRVCCPPPCHTHTQVMWLLLSCCQSLNGNVPARCYQAQRAKQQQQVTVKQHPQTHLQTPRLLLLLTLLLNSRWRCSV